MLVLGIESSCDETAVAVVEDGVRVHASVVASQVDSHAAYGGVVPEIASRLHAERLQLVLERALSDSSITLNDIDRIAVSNRPGLVGALLVGVAAAKALAWSTDTPLVGVNHVHAHLAAPFLETSLSIDAHMPAIGLVASGGHTSLYVVRTGWKFERIGGTIDDAVGEAYDKAASVLELGYPGGPVIDKLAQAASADDRNGSPAFPISNLGPSSLDLSFSGLKTAVLYAVKGVPTRDTMTGKPVYERAASDLTMNQVRGICSAFQHAAVEAIERKLIRAYEHITAAGIQPCSLLIGGGVAANSALREAAHRFALKRQIPACIPEFAYCIDNAAMIAAMGYYTDPLDQSAMVELDAHARSHA